MEMSNWNAIWEEGQDMGGDADAADWRTRLPEGSRQRSVNEIMYTLKRHFPFFGFFGEEGIPEHKKIAIRFEEKTYIAATSQSDYWRMIFSGMLNLERESQNSNFNAVSYSQNPQYPAAGMDAGDWRIQLPAVSRQRIVNKIMDTLGRHIPFSGLDGLRELMKIAMRFEGKHFASATIRLLEKDVFEDDGLETKSLNPTANSIQFNAARY